MNHLNFTTVEAARIAELSVHMVNYLCRTRLVRPTGAGRRGRPRRYRFGDLVLLRLLARLLKHGISVQRLKEGLAALYRTRALPDIAVYSSYLVTDGRQLYFRDEARLEVLATGQFAFAFVLELNALRREVKSRVEQLAA